MPITRSAIKKLRRDKKKEKENQKRKAQLKTAIKKAVKEKNPKSVPQTLSLIDKAVKIHLIHKNKASRLKSKISKLVKDIKPSPKQESNKTTKSKKTTARKTVHSKSKKSPKK